MKAITIYRGSIRRERCTLFSLGRNPLLCRFSLVQIRRINPCICHLLRIVGLF